MGSSFDKLPPGKSETFLGSILNRSYNSQASGTEKCNWYVFACWSSMHQICRLVLGYAGPGVCLKGFRFNDLRRHVAFFNSDRC